VGLVEECAARIMPDQVYTHKGSDLNVDHRIVHQAVLTAFRPTPEQGVADIYSFEVPSSTEWAFSPSESFFRPQVYVDISAVLHVKLQALACYETEVRAFPHPRSPEALTAIARRWGSVAGCEAAEAFEAVRIVRKKGMEL
jgi:LmbE family N-acetylglucosaminyl deacetylase